MPTENETIAAGTGQDKPDKEPLKVFEKQAGSYKEQEPSISGTSAATAILPTPFVLGGK